MKTKPIMKLKRKIFESLNNYSFVSADVFILREPRFLWVCAVSTFLTHMLRLLHCISVLRCAYMNNRQLREQWVFLARIWRCSFHCWKPKAQIRCDALQNQQNIHSSPYLRRLYDLSALLMKDVTFDGFDYHVRASVCSLYLVSCDFWTIYLTF